jgi:hypothetical protein
MRGTAIPLCTRQVAASALPSEALTTGREWCAPMAVTTGGVRVCIRPELVDQGLNFFSHEAFDVAAIGALMGGHRG